MIIRTKRQMLSVFLLLLLLFYYGNAFITYFNRKMDVEMSIIEVLIPSGLKPLENLKSGKYYETWSKIRINVDARSPIFYKSLSKLNHFFYFSDVFRSFLCSCQSL